jgi:hypothetical protein
MQDVELVLYHVATQQARWRDSFEEIMEQFPSGCKSCCTMS